MRKHSDVVFDEDFHFVSSTIPTDPDQKAVYSVLRLICDNWQHRWRDFLTTSALKAIFVEESPYLIDLFFQGLKRGFVGLLPQLQSREMSDKQRLKAQIYLHNCLSFLPFSAPKPGSTIQLPQWHKGEWHLITYVIKPIVLNPCSQRSRFFCHASDQFCAYGLTPIDTDLPVLAKLVFQASSYPAGKGFWQALKSDFNACQTPGQDILKSGQQPIDNWVEQVANPVEFVGISLGGMLAIQAAVNNGQVTRVHAYNPPGFYPYQGVQHKKRHFPEVHIIRNSGDPVSELGRFDARFNIHLLTPEKKYLSHLHLLHHALSFANKANTEVTTVSAATLNQANKRNDILYGPIRAAVDYLLIKPLDVGRNLIHCGQAIVQRLSH